MMHPQVELFVPDEMGCEHTLPDGVKVMVRLRLDMSDPANHRYVAEWMLPDRRPSTLHCIICICALALYTHTHIGCLFRYETLDFRYHAVSVPVLSVPVYHTHHVCILHAGGWRHLTS